MYTCVHVCTCVYAKVHKPLLLLVKGLAVGVWHSPQVKVSERDASLSVWVQHMFCTMMPV